MRLSADLVRFCSYPLDLIQECLASQAHTRIRFPFARSRFPDEWLPTPDKLPTGRSLGTGDFSRQIRACRPSDNAYDALSVKSGSDNFVSLILDP
jgi:hypothetical protein